MSRTETQKAVQIPQTSAGILPEGLIWFCLGGLFLVTRLIYLTKFPLFIDEGVYLWWGQRIQQGDLIRGLGEGKPLIAWLIGLFLSLGLGPIAAPRLVHVVMGGLSLLSVGLLARQFLSRSIALTVVALWVILPYPLFFERLATPDAALAALSILSTYLSVRLATQTRSDSPGDRRLPIVLSVILTAMMLTKMPVSFFFVSVPLAAGLMLGRPKQWSKLGRQLLYCYILPALFLGTVFIIVLVRWQRGISPLGFGFQELLIKGSFSDEKISLFEVSSSNVISLFTYFGSYLTWPLTIILLIGWLFALIRGERLIKLLAGLGGLYIAIFLPLSDFLPPRYLLPALPPLILVLGWAIVNSIRWLTMKITKYGPSQFSGRQYQSLISGALYGCLALVVGWSVLPFDGLILFRPQNAPLPALDRAQYIEEFGAGYGLPETAAYLETTAELMNGQAQIITLGISDYARLQSYIAPTLHPHLRQLHIVEGRSRNTSEQMDLLRNWLSKYPITYVVVGHQDGWSNAWTAAFPKAVLIHVFPKPGNLDAVHIYRLEHP